jgi:hypothetical protein
MTNVTRKQWDDICKNRIRDRVFVSGADAGKAIRDAHASMERDYGPRPDPEPIPPGEIVPPWWVRAALRVTVGKESKGMAQRVIVSLAYAVSAMVAAFQATGMPQTPEAWAGLVMAGVIAFWAKFSSNQTVLAANRPAWTEEQRKQEALDQLNKGL